MNGVRKAKQFLIGRSGQDSTPQSPGGPQGVLSANPESTEEFRVITDNFNAEYGRNTGAIIDVVTKSGTNALHGNVYYFGRWNGFGGARDYFNPGTGPNAGPMNPYIRHQFGFSIGGPIIKDKTFFFFNDEMDRFLTTLTNSASVPTPGVPDRAVQLQLHRYEWRVSRQHPDRHYPHGREQPLRLPV